MYSRPLFSAAGLQARKTAYPEEQVIKNLVEFSKKLTFAQRELGLSMHISIQTSASFLIWNTFLIHSSTTLNRPSKPGNIGTMRCNSHLRGGDKEEIEEQIKQVGAKVKLKWTVEDIM